MRESIVISRAEDDFFYAQENARLIKDVDIYYRTMFRGRVASGNLRDEHMAGTLEALMDHFALRDRELKVVVWAHNSHLGDARATDMGGAAGNGTRDSWCASAMELIPAQSGSAHIRER